MASKTLRFHLINRTATWLELFFDLIFVVVMSKITHLLAHTHDGHLEEGLWWKFPLMLLPVWWIWLIHTVWANIYDTDSKKHRSWTLFVMLQMIVLSSVIRTDWENLILEFNIIYFCLRLTLAIMFLVSNRAHEHSLGIQTGLVMILAACISLCSIFFKAPYAFVVLYFGLALDIIFPLILGLRGKIKNLHIHHFIERMGLLIIILMGESVISLSAGIADIHWDRNSILAAFSGAILIGATWWIYFDSYHRLADPHDRAEIALAYSYPHFLTCLGLAIMANAIHHAIHPGLARLEYQMMVIGGMTVFYVGKQIPYFAKFPPVRINILVNSTFTFLICLGALLLPNNAAILAGLTVALLFYVFVNFFTTIKKLHRIDNATHA